LWITAAAAWVPARFPMYRELMRDSLPADQISRDINRGGLIETEVKALGFDLVRVAMIGGKTDPTLQIMAERPDTRQLDLADCERCRAACPSGSTRWKRGGEDPIDGRLPARGQLARHRPAADPAQGLQRLAGARGAPEARPRVDGAKQVTISGDISRGRGRDHPIAGSQGTRRHSRSTPSIRPSCC
jgi:ribosome maturation factor RimP